MAVDSGVPIVPVIINGTWKIMAKDRIRIRSGDVLLNIAAPIETSAYDRKTKDDLMQEVRQVMIDSFEKTKRDGRLC